MSLKHRLRRKQIREQNFKCFYCSIKLTDETATLDHLIPSSRGGRTRESNIVFACKWCNSTKDDKTYEELDIIALSKYSPYKRIIDSLRTKNRLQRYRGNLFLLGS